MALPLGLVVGGAIPFLNFQAEKRDWGKVYSNYNDFVDGYVLWGLEYIAIATVVLWIVGVGIMTVIDRRLSSTRAIREIQTTHSS